MFWFRYFFIQQSLFLVHGSYIIFVRASWSVVRNFCGSADIQYYVVQVSNYKLPSGHHGLARPIFKFLRPRQRELVLLPQIGCQRNGKYMGAVDDTDTAATMSYKMAAFSFAGILIAGNRPEAHRGHRFTRLTSGCSMAGGERCVSERISSVSSQRSATVPLCAPLCGSLEWAPSSRG